MNHLWVPLIAWPAAAWIAFALVSGWSRIGVLRCRQLVVILAAVQCACAMVMAAGFVLGWVPVIAMEIVSLPATWPLRLSVFYDGVSALMLALVSFVGWVICRYSQRYLAGERQEGRYYRWVAFTIGAVSLLAVSGNLLMFFCCWVCTSLGLHQLLLHFGDRPAARRAAWTKFTISRLGDTALIAAIAIIASELKTLELADLGAAVAALTGAATPALQVAGWLLIAGAVTKSAQFPFHTWLPLTMETPTPVSALMHAGIVNAGGYLIIRTSPLLTFTPWALTALAIVGAVTACYGAVVMLTQTSVKKSLAYSTIAQMGFMMLQCGLGAFSAAMLHILAHSLYKAHAFLSSGSVILQRTATAGVPAVQHSVAWTRLALVGAANMLFLGAALTICGVHLTEKPGGILLGSILCLALTHWIGQVMRSGDRQLLTRSLLLAPALCLCYAGCFAFVDAVVAASLPQVIAPAGVWLVAAIILTGFGGMFALHLGLATGKTPRWMSICYVHASNGFYIEPLLRRIFGPLRST